MARFNILGSLLRRARIKKFRVSKAIKATALLASGGAIGGFGAAPPGGRREGAKEGIIAGVATGVLAVGAASVTRLLFRRIRGRIIPIRVKR